MNHEVEAFPGELHALRQIAHEVSQQQWSTVRTQFGIQQAFKYYERKKHEHLNEKLRDKEIPLHWSDSGDGNIEQSAPVGDSYRNANEIRDEIRGV